MASDGVTFRIREARPEDVFALAALHVETFKQAHRHRRAPSYELRETQWRSRAGQEPRRGSFTADTAGGTCAVSLRRRREPCAALGRPWDPREISRGSLVIPLRTLTALRAAAEAAEYL
jgi:hypothetical protein